MVRRTWSPKWWGRRNDGSRYRALREVGTPRIEVKGVSYSKGASLYANAMVESPRLRLNVGFES